MAKALRLSIALAAMLLVTPAMAVPINITIVDNDHYQSGTAAAPGPSIVVPQGPDAVAPVLTDVIGTVLYIDPPPGSSAGNWRSPWQNTKAADNTEYEPIGNYTSVQANSSGEIFYGLGSQKDGLALVWGSPDTYNEIRFFAGGIEVASLTGTDVVASAYGLNFVVLSLISGVFDTVRFYSIGSNAFEFSNVQAFPNDAPPVPLPAGLLLLLSGLGGLGFLGRARAKSA